MKNRSLMFAGAIILIIVFVAAIFYPSVHKASVKEEQNKSVVDQDRNLPSNKIFSILPYYSPYYELQAQPSNPTPNILFTYLPPPPNSNLPNSDEQTAINNAMSWLSDHGISTSQYKIINTGTNQDLN